MVSGNEEKVWQGKQRSVWENSVENGNGNKTGLPAFYIVPSHDFTRLATNFSDPPAFSRVGTQVPPRRDTRSPQDFREPRLQISIRAVQRNSSSQALQHPGSFR